MAYSYRCPGVAVGTRCGRRWVKDHRMIAFDAQLEGGDKHYNVKAVICHSGRETRGHYIAYVRSVLDQWHKCCRGTM